MLEGALILLAGIIIGRMLPARRKTGAPKLPEPVCGCSHHRAFHNPETGACGTVNHAVYEAGKPAPCRCRQYTGPEPLPEFFVPEIGEASA